MTWYEVNAWRTMEADSKEEALEKFKKAVLNMAYKKVKVTRYVCICERCNRTITDEFDHISEECPENFHKDYAQKL